MATRKRMGPTEKSVYTLDLREALSHEGPTEEQTLASYAVPDQAKQDLERYLALTKQPNIFLRFFKRVFHVCWWGIRLGMPSFLVGHPSLWDNLKTLWKNPQFQPLRMLGVAWLIFIVTFGSIGVYSFVNALHSHAAGAATIQTGYYVGTGVPLTITGIGFTPQLIIIKSDTAAGSAIFKTSSMPSGEYAYLGNATADNTENQLTLNSNGFTVQQTADVNTVGVRYIYIAFGNSNCTSSGTMCLSTYVGNGATTQTINTGFQPDLIWLKRPTALGAEFRTSSMPTNYTDFFAATADDTTGLFTTINSTGYTVGGTNNTNGALYYSVAFKAASGFLSVGAYTGNGTSTSITGLSFTPNFVLTKAENVATVPAFNTTQNYGDYSSVTTAAANVVNAIVGITSNGFYTSNSADSNTAATPYDWFAFGGAPALSTSGSFTLRRGYYVGNGTTNTITGVGFTPDLVLIKSDNSADYSVWSSSLDYSTSHYFAVATADLNNGLLLMNSDGFSVGTSSTVNTNAITYEYVAFGNATSPQNGPQAQDFFVGAYTGNGSSTRAITGLGIAPDFVVVKSSGAAVATWRSSSMSTSTGALFTAAADDTSGAYFVTLDNNGFTLGNNTSVNTLGTLYKYFGFKKGTGTFTVGSYTGNGVATSVTSVGFQPDLAWVKSTSTAGAAVYKSSSTGWFVGSSTSFTNVTDISQAITGFLSNGFSVGTGATVNTSANVYRWAAWKASGATTSPNTPTNSSPANASTTVDLNISLVGSAYSDPNNVSQTGTQWQVDDAIDFNTPVWTRSTNSAETGTVVNSTNGTFSSALAGLSELNHNSTYYWRVRYYNGLWSSWSTPTSFTTNIINTPTNSSPVDGTTTTTLTPQLQASAFSDQEATDTAAYTEWQLDTSNSFTSPRYDTGAVSYSNSYTLPAALLSNLGSYYWRVRYEDQSGQWSSYSTPTRFLISQSVISVTPLFTNTIVNQGDQINIDVQIGLTSGTMVNDAVATINIYSPSGTPIVSGGTVSYLAGSNGIYQYSYTAPNTSGSYLYQVTATEGGNTGYGAGNFQVGTLASTLSTINSTANTINSTTNTINSTASAISSTTNNINSTTYDISSTSNAVNSTANTINSTTNTINTTANTINTTASAISSTTNNINSTAYGISSTTNAINATVATINTNINTINSNVATLISQIGTGVIASIQTKTNSINWNDITGLVASTSAIEAKTDSINWTDVSAIKTQTDTINWSDVTGIKLNTDTINWGDITAIKDNVSTLISQIGTGNIAALVTTVNGISSTTSTIASTTSAIASTTAAINTKTSTINWADITGIVTSDGTIQAKTDAIDWNDVTAIKTSTDTINWADVTGIKLKTDSIDWSDVTALQNSVNNVNTNLDVLIGALIVTQSSVADSTPSSTLFLTSLTNTTDNFYQDAVLTFTTGNLKGQSRRISAYTGSTKAIRLDPALSQAPANGDLFTIVAQNVHAEQLISGVASTTSAIGTTTAAIASTTADTNARVLNIQATVNSINNTLNTINSTLDSLQTTVSAIRTSQQSSYSVDLTSPDQVQAGTTYRTTLEVTDYQSQAVDASSTPAVVVYDPTRAIAVATTSMTRTGTGQYEYTYAVSSNATAGLWETVATIPLGAGTMTRINYWQVTGAPAQVIINDVNGLTVPTISADVTITNEGNGPYEYQYQWCVVASQDNQCGGGDDIAYASAYKLIQPTESFTPTLSLTVPNPGNYWFKLLVTYGTQTSAASRNFTAVSSTTESSGNTNSNSGTSYGLLSGNSTLDQTAVIQQLQSNATQLNKVIALLGDVDPTAPGFTSLLQVNEQNTESVKDVQNKLNDLQAVSDTIHQLVSSNSSSPVVQSYMKFNSIVLSFLITNPENTSQTMHFKALLPAEVKPEDIMNADGLTVDYDPTSAAYEVSSDITLGPGQSLTKNVEMKDIWVFPADTLSNLQQKITSYTKSLAGTQYQAQGTLLSTDASNVLSSVEQSQTASYDTPQNHIVVYRSNVVLMAQATDDVTKLQDLVTEAGAGAGLLGSVGGIQTFATWGIILAMILGFGLMAAIIFSMWRHQMMLTAMAMGLDHQNIRTNFPMRRRRIVSDI